MNLDAIQHMTPDERIEPLTRLKKNWDTYGAKPPTTKALSSALALLRFMQPVPINDGGVQIEVHACGIDFEILIGPNGVVKGICYEDVRRGK